MEGLQAALVGAVWRATFNGKKEAVIHNPTSTLMPFYHISACDVAELPRNHKVWIYILPKDKQCSK